MLNTYLLITLLAVWLLGLSILFYYQYTVYKRLTKGISEKDIVTLLNSLLKSYEDGKSSLNLLREMVEKNFAEGRRHIKRVGLVKYNPFNDMGGDHSFTLCLLDDRLNGFVLTNLHTRERTRAYIKDIIKGKSKQELSKEEIKAIGIATKQ